MWEFHTNVNKMSRLMDNSFALSKFIIDGRISGAVVFTLFVVLCVTPQALSDSVNVVYLNRNWSLRNQNGSIYIKDVIIPSGVYSSMYGENVLDSWNDVNLRWIAYDNWTYTNEFSVNTTELKNIRFKNLTLYGIDTVAEVRLNHYLLGRTDNMFVRYSFEISKYLKEENLLEIEILSPVHAALQKANELMAQGIEVPPNCPNPRYHGECHMNMLRKMQASFSWDWGLAAPSMGIWKTVALEYYDVALIREVDVAMTKNDTHWNMDVRVFIDSAGHHDFYAELTFYAVELLKNPLIINDYTKVPISYKAPVIMFQVAFPINKVTLWWPNGHGEQKLYPLHFSLKAWWDASGTSLRNRVTSKKSIRVGFRTIELVEDAVSEGTGNSFFFRVNGKEIFMKGSNYIPSHILPEYSFDALRIGHLLNSAKEAHHNMIRVWGGGIYESDYFYDLADASGILIWQDMMFACAMYPTTDSFLASVRKEVVQNAQRLSHHASVAIFATNNENEVAIAQNWYGTMEERYKTEYRELYLATVVHELKVVGHNDRPNPLVSSPSNGKESAKDNYISENPQDPNYGDVHFYDVFKDGWNPSIYPRPRFASEYGFQSIPSLTAWRRSMYDNDSLSDLIEHRQHHPLGMLAITTLVRQHFPLPLPEDDNYLEGLAYFSQLTQAMATKVETEFYRSLRNTEHRTMGALYWQLNDVWVAPSWSAIDFYGNFKLLHYWSKEFLAPIAIVALPDSRTNSINVSLICDDFKVETEGLYVSMHIYKWSQLYPKDTKTWPATLVPNGVHYDKVIPIDGIMNGEFTKQNSFVEFVLHRYNQIMAHTFYFPTTFNNVQAIKDPELDLEVRNTYCRTAANVKLNSFSLALTTKYPAIFVYIELLLESRNDIKNYKLSKNGFMLTSGSCVVHLEFESSKCVKLKRSDLNVLTVNQFLKV
ncbi:beta-mannosidase [Stomoxys calcitrans]|uniref:beta-mannosidase n=1 Tax=Stomoxys calcitrans TaxID=35570 RepID=UPI0027E24C53|nr:beta-mannosidase [Stomoxys calcitrans]